MVSVAVRCFTSVSCKHTAKPDFQGMKSLSSMIRLTSVLPTASHVQARSLPVVARGGGTARRYHVGLLCERLYRASRDFHLTEAAYCAYCFAPKEASWCLHIVDPWISVQDCLRINTTFLPTSIRSPLTQVWIYTTQSAQIWSY